MTSKIDTKTSSASEPETETNKSFDLSITQVVGGALAAMTAAALGSRLSVAGTVIGAALASIIAAVAGALYTTSLRRTRDKVRSVWTGTTGGTPTRVEVVTEEFAAVETDAAKPYRAVAEPPVERRTPWRNGRLWKRIAVGAIATFALAAGALTGLELVSGQALSGGSGTTFEQVREPRTTSSDTEQREPSESPSESTDAATPSSEESSPSADESSGQPSTESSDESTSSASSSSSGPSETSSGDPTDQPSESSAGAAEPQADGNADAGGAE